VFHGTHTGAGVPVPPNRRHTSTDYVYVMQFESDKIAHRTKIWHAGLAKERAWLGLAGARRRKVGAKFTEVARGRRHKCRYRLQSKGLIRATFY